MSTDRIWCKALQEVQLGYIHLSEEAEMALNQFQRKIIDYPPNHIDRPRKQIVKLMIDGLTNKEISNALFISESTVETTEKNIYRKTETHSLPKLIQGLPISIYWQINLRLL